MLKSTDVLRRKLSQETVSRLCPTNSQSERATCRSALFIKLGCFHCFFSSSLCFSHSLPFIPPDNRSSAGRCAAGGGECRASGHYLLLLLHADQLLQSGPCCVILQLTSGKTFWQCKVLVLLSGLMYYEVTLIMQLLYNQIIVVFGRYCGKNTRNKSLPGDLCVCHGFRNTVWILLT